MTSVSPIFISLASKNLVTDSSFSNVANTEPCNKKHNHTLQTSHAPSKNCRLAKKEERVTYKPIRDIVQLFQLNILLATSHSDVFAIAALSKFV